MPRRLAAIPSADVAGYSRLMAHDDATTVETLTAHRAIVAGLVAEHHGRVVGSPGDNVLVERSRATAPTRTAGTPTSTPSYKQQATETDRKKREALLHQIQRLVYERVRYGPIFDYIWPSGIGPRVAEPALMLINPYPWSAPLEEVRLKRP
jgi:class 3 adenylate cyclase